MARLVLRSPQAAPVYPQVEHDYLLQAFQQELKSGSQCHPRLKCIQNGHAIFESHFKVQYTAKCKVGYRVVCRVPLTDPLFLTEKQVDYLYYSQAAPWMNFYPEGYYDKNGSAIASPI